MVSLVNFTQWMINAVLMVSCPGRLRECSLITAGERTVEPRICPPQQSQNFATGGWPCRLWAIMKALNGKLVCKLATCPVLIIDPLRTNTTELHGLICLRVYSEEIVRILLSVLSRWLTGRLIPDRNAANFTHEWKSPGTVFTFTLNYTKTIILSRLYSHKYDNISLPKS